MAELKKLLGRQIKQIRKNKNIKQDELAEMIGIATRNLSNIETGHCFPSADSLEKIAKALDCKVKDLFDFEHHKDEKDLSEEIIIRLKSINRKRLQDFYKIICALND